MDRLKVGRIVNTFGILGELKVLSESDFIEERFSKGKVLYLDNQEKVEVTSFRMHQDNVLIRINDLEDINLVEKYKNMDVYFDKEDMEVLDDGYYFFQLKDLDVFIDDNKVGSVTEVIQPSQTVLKIQLEDREILLPFVNEFILNVDIKAKRIDINLIEGF